MKDKITLIREQAEADIIVFTRLVAPYLVLGSVHTELLAWMTRQESRDNILILLPRGHLKSRMAAIWAAWEITKDPTTTLLYVSATADLAEKQLGLIKQMMDSPIYRRYWPEMIHPEEGKREKWAVEEIMVDHPLRKLNGVRDPTVKAIGITGGTTGFHASRVVLDDLVVPQNAYTEEGRTKVDSLYSQLASIENPGAKELVVGTRYHPRDLYNTLVTMKETIYNDEGDIEDESDVYDVFQRVVEIDGEFLWPRQQRKDGSWFGFDAKTLARIKAKYVDTTQYYAQYYNDPNSAESVAIDSSKFQYYERKLLREEGGTWFLKDRKLNVYAAIDFAFSLKKKADYTALVVVGVDSLGNYYVLDIERFKTSKIVDYFSAIVKMQQKWGFRKIRAEITVAQLAVVNELRDSYIKPNGLPLSIDEYRPSRHEGDKEERIEAILAPKYENLQIWHYKGGNCQTLEEELVMQRPPHDDVKEALANAINIALIPRAYQASSNISSINVHPRFGGII